jgi:serine/threonine protein kinase
MIATGTVFGPYRIIEKIGAGGMGDVYRALDTRLEREVALKLISDSFFIVRAWRRQSFTGRYSALPRPLLP